MTTPEGETLVAGYVIPAESSAGLNEALAHRQHDHWFMPYLVESGVVSRDMAPAKLLPVVYGVLEPDVRRGRLGSITITPVPEPVLIPREEKSIEQWTPHYWTRQGVMGKLKRKGDYKTYPAYVLEGQGKRTFTIDDETEYGVERTGHLSSEVLRAVALAHGIGSVSVGSELVVGNIADAQPHNLARVIRDLGQIIIPLPYPERVKQGILREAINNLSQHKSPDYRKWVSPPARPKKKK